MKMSDIPKNEVTQIDLETWYKLDQQIKDLKSHEVLLRRKIFGGLFTDPVEGTNSHALPDGAVVKGKRVISRTIDIGALNALREQFAVAGIRADELVKYTPELKVSGYRELTAEQQHLFDQALVIKDGMPGLEIVIPKRGK
jgi:hypothetical protein